MQARKILSLIIFFSLVATICAVLSVLTNTVYHQWYLDLRKPAWLPPRWALNIIWFIVFSLIAISGWRVWNSLQNLNFAEKILHKVMIPYWSQLIINLAWSLLFWGSHQPLLAEADIFILIILVAVNILSFASIDKMAAVMLFPYFLWIAYASYLSIAFANLN